MGSKKPLSRKNDLVIQEHDGEILIYDLTDNRALCLNETSARVWRACDGTNSVEDISRLVGNEDLVWLALAELKKEKLVDHGSAMPEKFGGMSRRQVIRKIGVGSMIALPVIASLVAPMAVQAASCATVTCGSPADCAPQPLGCRSCVNPGGGAPKVCAP